MAAPAAASGGVRTRGAGRDKMAAASVTCRAGGDGGLGETAANEKRWRAGGSQWEAAEGGRPGDVTTLRLDAHAQCGASPFGACAVLRRHIRGPREGRSGRYHRD